MLIIIAPLLLVLLIAPLLIAIYFRRKNKFACKNNPHLFYFDALNKLAYQITEVRKNQTFIISANLKTIQNAKGDIKNFLIPILSIIRTPLNKLKNTNLDNQYSTIQYGNVEVQFKIQTEIDIFGNKNIASCKKISYKEF